MMYFNVGRPQLSLTIMTLSGVVSELPVRIVNSDCSYCCNRAGMWDAHIRLRGAKGTCRIIIWTLQMSAYMHLCSSDSTSLGRGLVTLRTSGYAGGKEHSFCYYKHMYIQGRLAEFNVMLSLGESTNSNAISHRLYQDAESDGITTTKCSSCLPGSNWSKL